ncbi:MAG: winged helix-turn-helix domain-containing protein [Acidobacteria bacterium]|nr:winged helix-turn-helix domain-containing protein [Acidobacteriota bacterium]
MIHRIERQFVRTERPLYGHLVTLLESAISSGELPSGAKVPPERELAQRLRISRTTVVSAYRELEARGLLRGYVGRGTFVCAVPEPAGTPFAWRGKIASAATRRSSATPERSGVTGRRKDSRRCAARLPIASACRPRACWCSQVPSRGWI